MMDDGSLGRHGLGLCSSWLDGVPFKVGPKFRPPPKVIYQPIIRNVCGSAVSKEEYTFETEEAVLAWAKAREEALRKASLKQAEKTAKASADAEKFAGRNQPEQIVKEDGTNTLTTNGNTGDNSASNKAEEVQHQNQVKLPPVSAKPLTPKPIPQPGGILKPTPIQHVNPVSDQNGIQPNENSTSNSAFDVRMFEQVDDPFDNLELQTLDDMEELKVLLDSTAVDNKQNNSEPEKDDKNLSKTSHDVANSESFYELASTSCWERFEDCGSTEEVPMKSNAENVPAQELIRNSESPSSDIGEYVEISEENCLDFSNINGLKQVPSANITNQTNPVNDALPGNLSSLESAHGIYKPVLPPIPNNNKTKISTSADNQAHLMEQNNSAPLNSSVSLNPSTNSVSFSNETLISTNSNTDRSKPIRIPPPPKPNRPPPPKPRKSGQMWSSAGPSLADSLETSKKPSEGPAINLYSRHSLIQSNPDLSEDISLKYSEPSPKSPVPQLNRYRPLPPTPSPRSSIDTRNEPLGLTDPYSSLSREAQTFTDRITSMGFLRAKVARAVQKFGQDEKEVLDHLFAVDMLVEKKYAPVHVEAALQSCKNDLDKAERLLEMQMQLEQLGFSSESVRDALVSSNMDHDKALDLLTA